MKICFYYSFPAQKNWNDSDLEMAGLPGSETAIVHISREMALKHEVTVYNRTSKEGNYHNVRYKNLRNFDYKENWDVFIVVRGQPPRLQYLRARLKLYWSIEEGSTLVKDWDRLLPFVKKVFTISSFHTQELLKRTEVPLEKIFQTRLGVCQAEYQDVLPKVKNKLIYCSVPRKGLENLPLIFALIKKEVPDASLVITSDYSLWGRRNAGTADYIRSFAGMPSVTFLGKVNRKRLINEQKTSMIHLYPCTFEELFCLSAMECQAAGTPCVCTDLGALSTTIQNGLTGSIVGTENGRVPIEKLAREVVALLRNPTKLKQMAEAARKRALQEFNYRKIVSEWEEKFAEWLE